jgi:hypothetical protein
VSTIQVDQETKAKLQSFGKKGETYQDIINRLYTIAVREQLRQYVSETPTVPIDDAISRAKKKWQE